MLSKTFVLLTAGLVLQGYASYAGEETFICRQRQAVFSCRARVFSTSTSCSSIPIVVSTPCSASSTVISETPPCSSDIATTTDIQQSSTLTTFGETTSQRTSIATPSSCSSCIKSGTTTMTSACTSCYFSTATWTSAPVATSTSRLIVSTPSPSPTPPVPPPSQPQSPPVPPPARPPGFMTFLTSLAQGFGTIATSLAANAPTILQSVQSIIPPPPPPRPTWDDCMRLRENQVAMAQCITRITSPLIFDMNHDGQVSAQTGLGITLSPEHPERHQGAAVNGDKMLAMSDLNGNGVIDITEVFGDQTVSPVTGKPLNAPNGFVALLLVAQIMQEFTPQSQIVVKLDGSTLVDIPALQAALRQVGRDLGFIGDNNVSQLEPIRDVTAVDVSDFIETFDDVRSGMTYAQKGFYLDNQNRPWKVVDVWFPEDHS